MILACGGPRVSNELAKELGYDAGFSKGTEPQHLATFIVRELAARLRGSRESRLPAPEPMTLSELTAPTRRLALVGLAKNTGKTEALAALLRELAAAGRRVGVTSVGRDGEERDVIDCAHREAARAPAGGQPRGDHRRAAARERPSRTSCSRRPACARRSAAC